PSARYLPVTWPQGCPLGAGLKRDATQRDRSGPTRLTQPEGCGEPYDLHCFRCCLPSRSRASLVGAVVVLSRLVALIDRCLPPELEGTGHWEQLHRSRA